MPLGVLTLLFCATRNTKNSSAFDSKSYFLRIVLSSHCPCDKGRFATPKKGLAPAMGQDAHSNGKKLVELFLPYIASFCGFIVILI